jgi:hypothetical protein
LLGGIGHVIGGTVGKVAVTGFDAIIHALFAPIAKFINTQLLGWLVAVPDFDYDDRGGGDEPAVLDSDLLWGAP